MKRLLEYAKLLAKDGEGMEKNGDEIEAIPKYIKVVDVLLLLAEETQSYPEWSNYISKAEYYQKRAKMMIHVAAMKKDKEEPAITNISTS